MLELVSSSFDHLPNAMGKIWRDIADGEKPGYYVSDLIHDGFCANDLQYGRRKSDFAIWAIGRVGTSFCSPGDEICDYLENHPEEYPVLYLIHRKGETWHIYRIA